MLGKTSFVLQSAPKPPSQLGSAQGVLTFTTAEPEPGIQRADAFEMVAHAADPFIPAVLAGGFLAVSAWDRFKGLFGIGSKPAGTPEGTSEPQTAASKPVVPQPDVSACQTPADFFRKTVEYDLAGAGPQELAAFIEDRTDLFFSLKPTFEDVQRFYLHAKSSPQVILAVARRAVEAGVVKSAEEFCRLRTDLNIYVFEGKVLQSDSARTKFLEGYIQAILNLPDAGDNLYLILSDPAYPFEVVHRVLQQAYGEGLVTEAGAFVRDVSLLARFKDRTMEVYNFAITHFLQFPNISAKQIRKLGLAFPVAEAADLWAVAAYDILRTKSDLYELLDLREDGPQRTLGSATAHCFLMLLLDRRSLERIGLNVVERFDLNVNDMKKIIGLFYGAKEVRPLLEKAVELGFANDPDSLLQLLSQQYESMLVLLYGLDDRKDGTFYDARADFVQKNVETFFKLEPGPTFEQALVFLSYGRGDFDSAVVEKMRECGFLDTPLKFLRVFKTLSDYPNPQRASQIVAEYADFFRSFSPLPNFEESLEFANYLSVEDAIELYRGLLTRNAVESSTHVLKLLRQLPYRGDRNVDLGEILRRVYEYAKGHELLTDKVVREVETRLQELA